MRSARPTTLLAVLFTAIPTLMAFPGCTKTTEAPAASRLTIVQGHLQQAAAGTLLPTPVVLRVYGTDGMPMANIPVSFNVLAGGGAIDPPTAKSDANGEVKARWTLGPGYQVQTVVGSAPGVDPVTLSALGVLPTDITIAQGNNQSAKASTALPVQLVLRVTGGNNVPIPGQTVALTITSGGGSLSPQSAVTNNLGEVTVRWTLGPQAGLQTATATSGTVGPITITAVAN
ncbi:Ig-like domain-containing protein [Gemmatimonas sp.]